MQSPQPPDFMVFTGNANPEMAADIASHLNIKLGDATRSEERRVGKECA